MRRLEHGCQVAPQLDLELTLLRCEDDGVDKPPQCFSGGRMIPIGERHFRRAVAEYVEHYHQERNHQGRDNRLIAGTPVVDMTRRVQRRLRLGGLLNFYERAA